MNVSVIVPTYNESEVIENCLRSLENQNYSSFEIIVVDDGSSDKTVKIVQNFRLSFSNLRYFEQKHKGPGEARNLGAKHAKGKVLVFVDADMTFDKDFLKKLTEPIALGVQKGTWSREEFVSNWDDIWARCWSINEGWEARRRHPESYPNHQPVFRAILKSEFDRVGGFTPGGYDDDWSLSKKLGYEAINAPGAIFYHKNPSTLLEIFNHAKWVGKRNYKFGFFGEMVGLLRACIPISIIVGIYKGCRSSVAVFPLFKVVYDLGIFFGILEFLLTGRSSK